MPKKKSVWTKALKQEVKSDFQGWLNSAGVKYQRVLYHFHEEDTESTETGAATFSVSTGYPYHWIRLDCYPNALVDADRDARITWLLHEVIHCILEPMEKSRLKPDEIYRDGVELSVEHLTEWIIRFRYKCEELEKQKKKR